VAVIATFAAKAVSAVEIAIPDRHPTCVEHRDFAVADFSVPLHATELLLPQPLR
jgi:hypothetical protein